MEATCPACQKQFRNVRQELLGKKALCTCGHTFKLGQPSPTSDRAAVDRDSTVARDAVNHGDASDSVDLSSESVFENSYSDLDQILSGHGSTAPLQPDKAPTPAVANPGASAVLFDPKVRDSTRPSTRHPNDRDQHSPSTSYGSTGMSVGFLAAFLSSCAAGGFSLFVLLSRFSVVNYQPLNFVSQTLHDLNQGTFGDLSISVGLERSFVVLSWSIWIAAACLLCFAACQLINAFAKLFRRRRLLPGIDGITGLTAVALLFMILSTLFLHFNHMRQLNRELLKNAGGQVDENTVLGRNFLERQSVHDDHSRQFMTSILVAAGPPLFVCLLSLSRVYVTLGEPDFTPSRRENP